MLISLEHFPLLTFVSGPHAPALGSTHVGFNAWVSSRALAKIYGLHHRKPLCPVGKMGLDNFLRQFGMDEALFEYSLKNHLPTGAK